MAVTRADKEAELQNLERAFGGAEEPDPHVAEFIASKRAQMAAAAPPERPPSSCTR